MQSPINLVAQPVSLEAFVATSERQLTALQLPKPPLWYVAQEGIARDRPEGLWLEFGTGSGTTARMLCNARTAGPVYTFDSFEGLPEDWIEEFPKGSFRFDPPKDLPANGHIVRGLFEETLVPFLEAHPGPADLVHIDCDLYASTRAALEPLTDRIVPGTVMVFDELFYYPGREDHEAKALYEWLSRTGKSFEWIGVHGTRPGNYFADRARSDPANALAYVVSLDTCMVRFDLPLIERTALRFV